MMVTMSFMIGAVPSQIYAACQTKASYPSSVSPLGPRRALRWTPTFSRRPKPNMTASMAVPAVGDQRQWHPDHRD